MARKILTVAFLLPLIAACASTSPRRGPSSVTPDSQLYRLVCNDSFTAQVEQGGLGLPSCVYVSAAGVSYLGAHQPPCDSSEMGKYLKAVLGGWCNAGKSLTVQPDVFSHSHVCDDSVTGQVIDGATGNLQGCHEVFQVIKGN